ncbi:hypothetical protein I5M27_17550 [Adhaeribacter sp. BT258]|uniref:Uncharacterized protein n=1 Tax=Adhaeribacter terrigena TaxID=2793070 RepID=A0ABS1C600_9BACT|nr:hypothetical protein [Adhaeribacter terrigena]MBK0404801.1 hypothetical protein [Adhaeribacter terrigena]
MKRIIFLSIFIIISLKLQAQEKKSWTDFDTIQIFPNKVLVHFKTFEDSTLIESTQAYLYPTIIKVPKFRLLGIFFFKTELKADSIVYHGTKTSFLSNRFYKIEEFENGLLLKGPMFFDTNGIEITEQEFLAKNNVRGPCGEIIERYFITGQKK